MKKTVGIDVRMAFHSGIGTYIREILPYMLRDARFNVVLFGPRKILDQYPSARKVLWDCPIYSIKEQWQLPLLLLKNKVDLFHSPHYNVPLFWFGLQLCTIHDLIHLKFPPGFAHIVYAQLLLRAAVFKSKKVLTNSNNSAADIVSLLNAPTDKINITLLGPGQSDLNVEESNIPDNEKTFILCVGNIKPAKNVTTLIEAFLKVKDVIADAQLVLIGKNFMPHLQQKYKAESRIVFTGPLTTAEMQHYYNRARLFVHPSLYEGFGLTLLEAMRKKIPLICSNTSSMPQVAGQAAVFFDPKQSSQLAQHLTHLWQDPLKRQDLIQKGLENVKRFSWQNCAQATLDTYAKVLKI